MKTHVWQFESVFITKRQGAVWAVRSPDGTRGYFKSGCATGYRAPVVANEMIAATLARKLGLPVAPVEVAVVRGPDGTLGRGLVSVQVRAGEVVPWSWASPDVHERPCEYLAGCRLLAGVTVFDAWVTNVDRADGENLILWRNNRNEKFRWYLIDHALTLWGARAKWDGRPWGSPVWQRLWEFYHVPHGLLKIQSWQTLAPMIRRIESLTKREIRAAVNAAPAGSISPRVRRFTLRLLLTRQRQLRRIIRRWLGYQGIKERAAWNPQSPTTN